jgi:hypothetical protein
MSTVSTSQSFLQFGKQIIIRAQIPLILITRREDLVKKLYAILTLVLVSKQLGAQFFCNVFI